MVDELESLTETYNAISALFPDNAPHKNPVTGVSLLDDVRDMMEERHKYAFEAYQYANDLKVAEERLDNAALQMRQLQTNNDQLFKSLAEPLATALPPKYILVPLHCIFCSFNGTLAELKQHSAVCQEHPAVKAMAGRRGSGVVTVTADTIGQISDGYHTFDELYEHRFELWMAICRNLRRDIAVYKSRIHSDGTNYPGWFLLAMGTKAGSQISYHLPDRLWDACDFEEMQPPPLDGHTSADVLERLRSL